MRPDVRYWDKMLPNQHEHANLYKGDNFERDLFHCISRSSGIGDPKNEFTLEESDMFSVEEMASNPIAMHYLQFMMKLAGVKRVLEIGAFIGFSAMSFAKALPADGKVVSIEKFDKFAGIAKRNFEANGLADKIDLHQGDAFEIIDGLPKDQLFDLIFIDGNKERYNDYFEKTEPLLSPNGIMLVDDCFYHGDVLNDAPGDAKGEGTKAFMDNAATQDGWHRIALPVSNGLFMMIRK
ncbi:MAG: O-methyltransferase [Pseudomonadota bacterium]